MINQVISNSEMNNGCCFEVGKMDGLQGESRTSAG